MAKICKVNIPVEELDILISTLNWVLVATQPTDEDRKKLSNALYRLISARKVQIDVHKASGPLN